MSLNSIRTRIDKLSEEYYTTHNKSRIFKSAQKKDCADYISNNVSLNTLIHNTAFIINETNKVFIDYTIFKTYITPELFPNLIEHIKLLNINVIEQYGSFELHVNWATYSISAHERYKNIFPLFEEAHSNYKYDFSELVTKVYIYNTPSIINMITPFLKPLIDPAVLDKIVLYEKQNSAELLSKLFE